MPDLLKALAPVLLAAVEALLARRPILLLAWRLIREEITRQLAAGGPAVEPVLAKAAADLALLEAQQVALAWQEREGVGR